MFSPPHGLNITIDDENGYRKIVIPHKSGGRYRWVYAIGTLSVLGIWMLILVKILTSTNNGFLGLDGIAFLGFLLLSGSMQLWTAYRVLHSDVPEVLLLSKHEMLYDSGVAPFQYTFGSKSRAESWEKLFQKRREVSFGPAQLKTLSLRDFGGETRLTIDEKNERIDIAATASEPEREWLFDVLCKYYDLAREEKNPVSEARMTAAIDKVRRKSSEKKATRKAQECPYCQALTRIEVDGASKWEVCDACGWSGLVEGQK